MSGTDDWFKLITGEAAPEHPPVPLNHRAAAEQFIEAADRAETLQGVQAFLLYATTHLLLSIDDSLTRLLQPNEVR